MKQHTTIGVMGLGYVGVVNLVCFSRLGYRVIGCDIKSQKVDAVKQGSSPVHEPGVDELLSEGLREGRISATTDARVVVEKSDVIFVCVGTPSLADGTVNLDYTINTAMEIAKLLSGTSRNLHLVFRSTIPPGTVENILRPVISQNLVSYTGELKIAFYPEFLREGNAIKDFMEAPRIVIGTREKDISFLESLLNYNADSPVVVTDTETAEFVKYVDNAWHAMKVTFVNEMYALGGACGVDVAKANEIFLMDRQLNISTAYLRPGLPFGGSCLPKDLRAIRKLSQEKEVDAPAVNSALESNSRFQKRLAEAVLSTRKSKILLAGLTFKNHTDDVRESPMLFLAQHLISAGANLRIWDPDINLTTLRIENAGIVKFIGNDFAAMASDAEVIIACKRFMPDVAKIARQNQIVFNFADLKQYECAAEVRAIYAPQS